MNKEKLFESKARTFFNFLVEKFGLKEISSEKSTSSYGISIYYIINEFFIEVFYAFRGSEVGVNIGKKTKNGDEKFSLHMYFGIINPSLYYRLGYSIANKEEHVTELLDIYSSALKTDYLKIKNDYDNILKKLLNAKKTGSGLCPPYYDQDKTTKIISKFI